MTLVVTDAERAIAKQIKEDFKKILKKLNKAVRSIVDLRDAIVEQRPTKDDLKKKYRGRLLRYRRKIRAVFNEFLSSVKSSLENLAKISDPDMIKLREIIIAEIGELSDGAEAIIELLDETDREGFTKTIEQVTTQIEKRQKSIIEVIDSQLFNHIDHDILGKMKISNMQFRIRRRARIIKQLTRGN
jgi:regulator of sigma D